MGSGKWEMRDGRWEVRGGGWGEGTSIKNSYYKYTTIIVQRCLRDRVTDTTGCAVCRCWLSHRPCSQSFIRHFLAGPALDPGPFHSFLALRRVLVLLVLRFRVGFRTLRRVSQGMQRYYTTMVDADGPTHHALRHAGQTVKNCATKQPIKRGASACHIKIYIINK